MSAFSNGVRRLRCQSQLARAQWPQPAARRATFQLPIRTISTETPSGMTESERAEMIEAVKIPFQGITHARVVPPSPSYFSREPQFNDLYIRISQLLTQYHHLPTLPPNEAPSATWIKLEDMRSKLGEPVKAAHFSSVLEVAKRLQLIEPSLVPEEVTAALTEFKKDVQPNRNVPKPLTVDRYGRAVGVGKRKESTARAWVVEGTGEVLINGKPLTEAFGRVHDRESAVWALQATERLDKYNIWALVEGGGTTGQAEALTLAVAKALLAHEPALKPALRKAGCITRDPRTVERKKHGKVKARKMPAWVKR